MIEDEAEDFGSLAESFLPKFQAQSSKLQVAVTGHMSLCD